MKRTLIIVAGVIIVGGLFFASQNAELLMGRMLGRDSQSAVNQDSKKQSDSELLGWCGYIYPPSDKEGSGEGEPPNENPNIKPGEETIIEGNGPQGTVKKIDPKMGGKQQPTFIPKSGNPVLIPGTGGAVGTIAGGSGKKPGTQTGVPDGSDVPGNISGEQQGKEWVTCGCGETTKDVNHQKVACDFIPASYMCEDRWFCDRDKEFDWFKMHDDCSNAKIEMCFGSSGGPNALLSAACEAFVPYVMEAQCVTKEDCEEVAKMNKSGASAEDIAKKGLPSLNNCLSLYYPYWGYEGDIDFFDEGVDAGGGG